MKIKQLEWEEDSYGDFVASGFWGMFQVVHAESGEGFTASLNDYNNYEGYEEEDFTTADEGKAYCQSLLEKQVKAAMRFVEEPKKNAEGLIPCPFCGEEPIHVDFENQWYGKLKHRYGISCKQCGIGMLFGYETEQQAVDAWDKRM